MRDALRLPLAMAGAAAVGYASYLNAHTLYLLAAFPVLLTWSQHRLGAGLAAWAFFLAPCSGLVDVLRNWVAGTGAPLGHVEIYGYPLLLSVLLALPFLLVNPAAAPGRRALQMVVALLLLTVPPLGFVAWINPLLLAAALFPGAGIIFGLLLALAVMALLAAHAWKQSSHPAPRIGLALLLVSVVGAHSWEAVSPDPLPPAGWYGVDTRHPPVLPSDEARDFRAALIEAQARPFLEFPETRLLVFPESVLPDFEQADLDRLSSLREKLGKSGAAVLVGVTPRTGDNRWSNQLLMIGANDAKVVAETRIPVPVGNWRLGGTGVPIRGLESGVVEIDGTKASVSICYEEFPLWSHLRADQADVLISIANLWMLNPVTLQFQRTAASAISRLTGKALVRAENRLPSHPLKN
jgi:apolipoprotein N-acyltransferase